MSYHIQDYSPLDGGQLDYSNGMQLPNFGDGIALGQEYSLLQSILVDGGTHFGVSTVSFDNVEELLWMGNQGGHMTSYATAELQKYTSFQVHVSNEVRAIVPLEHGILSLTSNSLRMSARRGLPMFNHCIYYLIDMYDLCGIFTYIFEQSNCIKRRYPVNKWLHIYMNGSYLPETTGAGLGWFCQLFEGSLAMGKNTTNYDGEVLAVCGAIMQLLAAGLAPAKVVFFIDSHAAILALSINTPTALTQFSA
ncbi:PAN2-PAN3 deadenylation complex catalytic subunit PAN2 [Trichonephila clavipes]|uniref:PAN2-PAN3 deadenylation complex catalytic subunit PAN2 n=1 Tax=Trichonephila clavipes TaxID=2585209 RepID=A0A8X6WHQ8_TRICX|nr:PAN2-PAN3 deadenylation complex catalytic subunit PAN2 [Trichonephila clavipes]